MYARVLALVLTVAIGSNAFAQSPPRVFFKRYVLWKTRCDRDRQSNKTPDRQTISKSEAITALENAGVTLIRDSANQVTSVSFPASLDASLLRHLPALVDLRGVTIRGITLKAGDIQSLRSIKHLQILVLRNCALSNEAIDGLANLTRLEDLLIETANVDDRGLLKLARLPRLNYLDLKETNVTEYGVAEFDRLQPRALLRAKPRRIKDREIAVIFKRLGGIVSFAGDQAHAINLSRTQIKDEDLKCLRWLPNVRELDISHTNITGKAVKHIQMLTRLEILRNRGTKLTADDLVRIVEVRPRLEFDDVYDPKGDVQRRATSWRDSRAQASWTFMESTVKSRDILSVNPKLAATLWFINCTLPKETIAEFHQFDHLRAIHFIGGKNELLSYLSAHYEDWPDQIESLAFQDTQLTDDDIELLHLFPHLRELSITGGQLTDDALSDFAAMPRLCTLSLFDTGVTKEGARKLMQALPDCTIYHE